MIVGSLVSKEVVIRNFNNIIVNTSYFIEYKVRTCLITIIIGYIGYTLYYLFYSYYKKTVYIVCWMNLMIKSSYSFFILNYQLQYVFRNQYKGNVR